MITGAHSIIYSKSPEADREFLRDVLGFPHVDVGGGWLIFGLPPAEVAVHPGEENDQHELYLLTEDVAALVAAMVARGIACSPIANRGWGLLTDVALPGGGKLGIYQPRHARPDAVGAKAAAKKKPAKRAAAKKKPAKKPARKPAKPKAKKGRRR